MAEPRQEPPHRSRAGSVAGEQAVERDGHDQGGAGPDGHAQNDAARGDGDERCGALLLERHRKADGRQLILYRRVAADG
jgi:hypothetical protein